MSQTRQTDEIKPPKGEWVAFLQDNLFMGFVEPAGAKEIMRSAIWKGYTVERFDSYFNVVLRKGKVK